MASGDQSLSTTLEIVTAADCALRASAKRPEKPISRSVLHRILTNPYYTGIAVLRGVAVEGRHEAIVSRATFDKVQQTLESQRQGGLRTQYRPHYLAGTLYCGKCGRRLGFGQHTAKSGNKYAYFSCLSRSHPSGSCGAKYIPAHLAEKAIGAVHARRWLTDEETQQVREALHAFLSENASTARREAQRHQARERELLAQEQKLVQLFYADAVSEKRSKPNASALNRRRPTSNAGLASRREPSTRRTPPTTKPQRCSQHPSPPTWQPANKSDDSSTPAPSNASNSASDQTKN